MVLFAGGGRSRRMARAEWLIPRAATSRFEQLRLAPSYESMVPRDAWNGSAVADECDARRVLGDAESPRRYARRSCQPTLVD